MGCAICWSELSHDKCDGVNKMPVRQCECGDSFDVGSNMSAQRECEVCRSKKSADQKAAMILTKEDWAKLKKLASGNKPGGK